MKICALVKTRNESDIIESFCRYTLSYCDGIVIYCSPSADNTARIVQSMVDEGLNICVVGDVTGPDGVRPFNKYDMMDTAINVFGADLFLPMDPDEFYCLADGGAPRAALECLDENKSYAALWRTYIYDKEPGPGAIFVPSYFGEYRDSSLEHYKKVILSRKLYEKYRPAYTPAFHSLIFPEGSGVETVVSKDLVLGHFPVRNKPQIMVKVVTGRIYNQFMGNDYVFQYDYIYRQIKDTGTVSSELMRKFSMEYALEYDEIPEKIKTVKEGLDTSGCTADLTLKYTDMDDHDQGFILRSIFFEIDKAIEKHKGTLREIKEETARKVKEFEEESASKIRELEETVAMKQTIIDNIQSSKSYWLGNRLRKLYRIFVPKNL